MHSGLEKRLLSAAIVSRGSYNSVFAKLNPDKMSPIGKYVAELIKNYYEADVNATKVDRAVLAERANGKFVNPKQSEAVKAYIEGLDDDISVPNLLQDISDFKQQAIGDELAMAIANKSDKREIAELITKYQDASLVLSDDDETVYNSFSVERLVNKSFASEHLVKLLPKALNDKCDGGARPGHHILVYARPEIGKTLFVINLTAGFLAQNLKVLYVGNEDPATDLLIRVVARLSKMSKQQILEEPKKAEERAKAKGYDNLIIASLSPGNFFDIRKLVETHKPNVVILDQLRNIDVKSDSRVQGLEKAATEARNLGKKYGVVVVSVTQAGESAEGKAVLGRDDIDFSKTGIPAQVDLMIGIGADISMEKHGIRTVSLPKNKLSGNHDYFSISINPSIGTVEAI